MEEQILKIIENKESWSYGEFGSISHAVDHDKYPIISKEIASHFREFIEWMHDACEGAYHNNLWYVYELAANDSPNCFFTLDELYNYWLKEVKK